MAERDKKFDPDHHGSFEDVSLGIGQKADGTMDVFPASDLAARIAERDATEESTTYAIEESEMGGLLDEPDDDEDTERIWNQKLKSGELDDVGDISDLDDLSELLD